MKFRYAVSGSYYRNCDDNDDVVVIDPVPADVVDDVVPVVPVFPVVPVVVVVPVVPVGGVGTGSVVSRHVAENEPPALGLLLAPGVTKSDPSDCNESVKVVLVLLLPGMVSVPFAYAILYWR